MNLIGIQFLNYASFSKRYVPLGYPITVLAGRNNAGKTALLRGISVLNRISRNQSALGEPEKYCGPQYARMQHFRLIFEIDRDFATRVPWKEQDRRALVEEKHARLSCEFLGQLFGGSELIVGDQRWPFHICDAQGIKLCNLSPQGSVNSVQYLSPGSAIDLEGRRFYSAVPDIISQEPGKLKPVLLVEVHRSVNSDIPLRAEGDLNPDGSNLANFLSSLNNNRREAFQKIEKFVTTVFPEFVAINPENDPARNTVSITLTLRNG